MANSTEFKENISIQYLGRISHDKAMSLMMGAHTKCVENQGPDTLFLLEHEPVITKGFRMHNESYELSPKLKDRGVVVRNVDRGGLLTYHGYGQIVVYFVLSLKDYFSGPKELVRFVENILTRFLKTKGIIASTKNNQPGIWVGDKKIASIGFRIKDGVSLHGICLNVSNDLSVYEHFEPCGMNGQVMTNMEEVLKVSIGQERFEEYKQELGQMFKEVL